MEREPDLELQPTEERAEDPLLTELIGFFNEMGQAHSERDRAKLVEIYHELKQTCTASEELKDSIINEYLTYVS